MHEDKDMAEEKLLEIKNLHTVYHTDEDTVYAVNDLTLSLDKGQTLGLVGETGAGKTTTCLSILRLLPDKIGEVTNGSIRFDGKDILKISEEEMRGIRGQDIAMIFQDPMSSLNPVYTVGYQIAEALKYHSIEQMTDKAIEERVEEMLELVGIPKERKLEYPHQFSGGMKQRVVIAMALACYPKLLLADEPTTALDVTIQAQVLKLINELKEKLNTAVILVTHDLGIVAETCDQVAVMYAGSVIEKGPIETIFKGENHHPYTVGLFGSIPNLKVKTKRLNPIEGLMPDPANLPKGCAFNPRCPKCMDICREVEPPCVFEGEHMLKCHLFSEGKE